MTGVTCALQIRSKKKRGVCDDIENTCTNLKIVRLGIARTHGWVELAPMVPTSSSHRSSTVPHLTQDTNGKVTNSHLTPQTRAKRSALSQQVTTRHIHTDAHYSRAKNIHKTEKTYKIHKRSTALERSVKYFKLKIKRNDLLLADTCPQAANHCALF